MDNSKIVSNFAAVFMIKVILTIIPVLVCAMLTIQLMLEQRQRKDNLLRWLIVWGCASTLLYIGHFSYFNHTVEWLPLTASVYLAMNISVYPLYLLYISDLTDEHPLSARPAMVAWLLGPAIVALLACGTLFLLMSPQEETLFFQQFLYNGTFKGLEGLSLAQAVLHTLCRVIFVFQVIGVAVAGIRKVRRYNHLVSLYYADTDDKEAYGLTTLLYLFMLTSFLSAIFNFIGRQMFVDSDWLALPSIAFSALLFAIGWIGMSQRFSIRDIHMNAIEAEAEELPTTGEESQEQDADSLLYERFDEMIRSQKLYLEHDLRLDTVTKLLGTNRTYLLNALNNCQHITFKEYINKLRIEYAEQLMAESPDISKVDVAIKSGYNNTSSFYRNYNQYRKKARQEKKYE